MRLVSFFVAVSAFVAFAGASAAIGATRAEFDQLVQQIQAKPTDTALRERVIKMAAELKPAPAIPEEGRAAFVEGSTILKSATDPAQQKLAVQSFEEALKIAPWWGDAYYNLAFAQELAGQFASAKTSLKLYLLTKPGEKEAREAQDHIYALNAKIKLAGSKKPAESARGVGLARPPAPAAAQSDEKTALASLEGAIWLSPNILHTDGACANSGCTQQTTMHHRVGYIVRGGQLVTLYLQWIDGQSEPAASLGRLEWSESIMKPIPVTGRRLSGQAATLDPSCGTVTFVISDDSTRLNKTFSCLSVPAEEYVRAN